MRRGPIQGSARALSKLGKYRPTASARPTRQGNGHRKTLPPAPYDLRRRFATNPNAINPAAPLAELGSGTATGEPVS